MARQAPTSLPELPEAEATGEIAALYADMRAVLRIPVVNLIYRHIATLPGALPWCWQLLRPAYASGRVEMAAGQLVAGLRLPDVAQLTPAALTAAEVPESDRPTIRRVLETYHRANPLNLAALSALLAHLEGRAEPSGPLPNAPDDTERNREVAVGSDAPAPLPPMLTEPEMSPATAALVWRLAALGVSGTVGEMPSVWRNLAHWPGYLGLALAQLEPLAAEGWLAQEMDGLRARRDGLGAGLLGAAGGAVAPPDESVREALRVVLGRFTDGLIVRMIPLVAVLRGTLPPDPPSASR